MSRVVGVLAEARRDRTATMGGESSLPSGNRAACRTLEAMREHVANPDPAGLWSERSPHEKQPLVMEYATGPLADEFADLLIHLTLQCGAGGDRQADERVLTRFSREPL